MTTPRSVRHRLRAGLAAAAAILLAVLAGCTRQEFPQSSLHPQADYSWLIQKLNLQLTFWVVVIFVIVEGLLIVAVVRFRSRPGSPEPKHVHGNTALEVAWTIAPAIILALVAVPTVLTIWKTQRPPAGEVLKVKVVGHQWWWEFQYPDLGVTTASEMHVPLGHAVEVDIESADVLHSFWFPAVAGKRDAVPGHTNHIWFTADSLGEFPGQCAEFCGMSHANMRMRLFVETTDAFNAWVADQKRPPVEPADTTSLVAQGKQIFSTAACIGCHTIDGVSAGIIGPNLTHVGSRQTIAGGLFPNTPDEMAKWIADAPGRKPGAIMFPLAQLGITQEQIPALVAYLQSLK
jgi:cytochrome c oxidase subunit II